MCIRDRYDALATQFTFPVDRELIDAFPNIKLIANYGVGYNNIDVAYAHSKGITVTNTPRAVIQPTAELTMGLLPVSYTHLDVYKRQTLTRAWLSSAPSCLAAGSSTISATGRYRLYSRL